MMNDTEIRQRAMLDDDYRRGLEVDGHDHELIIDDRGTIRWKANPVIRKLVRDKIIDLNAVWDNAYEVYGEKAKNTWVMRNFYRQLGYSLFGYWEIFFWEANNEWSFEWGAEYTVDLTMAGSDEHCSKQYSPKKFFNMETNDEKV